MTPLAEAQFGLAFLLGSFSFFAPCAYPLLPGYLAYFFGNADAAEDRFGTVLRAVIIGLLVSLGFVIVYAALGGVVVLVGTRALSDVLFLELAVGALLVVLGTLMAVGRGPTMRVSLPKRRRSNLGFVLFGVVYAVAAAGCTALLSFSVVASALAAGPVVGLATLLAYVAGMSAVMVVVTVLAGLGKDALLRRLSDQTGRVERVAGALLVLAGLAQLYFFLFRFEGLALLGF
ncbi:MAG: cytochrome c biogenesis protein CcdA [Halobacteriales archaeon]